MSLNSNGQTIVNWISKRSGKIFGLRITPTTQDDIIDATAISIRYNEPLVIAHQNMHGLYMAMTNDAFRAVHELPQTMVHIDGFPLVYLAWLHNLRHTRMKHRAAVHDWLPHYMRAASDRRWRIYCLGSSADVNARAVLKLANMAPDAVVNGHDGYFDTAKGCAENQAVLDDIAAFNPDIILVGMGMGRQEQWILDNASEVNSPCIVAVGACLEYMTGDMQISPRWFGPFGLEAAFRLVTRPRRYAHRYLVEPWLLLGLLVKTGRLFSLKR